MYDDRGKEVPLGNLTASARQIKTQDAILSNQIKNIDAAVKTML